MDIVHYLRELLPNVDLITNLENREILMDPNIQREQKIILILLKHFNSQNTNYIDNLAVESEAKYINFLFPNLSRNYIVEQLDIFKDIPQRVEIVLRTIAYSKMNTNKSTAHGFKRICTTPRRPVPPNLNSCCQPIKIRKITLEGCGPNLTRDNPCGYVETNVRSVPADNCLFTNTPTFTSHSFITNNVPSNIVKSNQSRIVLNTNHIQTPKSCTITSVPHVQSNLGIIYENNKAPVFENHVIDLKTGEESSNFKDAENTLQNCDSSSRIREVPPPLMNSSVVSSSDEISTFSKSVDENVSTLAEQLNNVETAILETNTNFVSDELPNNVQDIFGADVDLMDESNLPVAQNCTVNSSNEVIDTINKTVYLDFFSEIEVGEPSVSLNLTSTTSQANGILSTVTEQTKDEELVEDLVPETSNRASNEKWENEDEELDDSDRTVLLSPFGDLNNAYKDFNEIDINGQNINDIPSTSKENNMSEEFDLIKYLGEITNAPVHVIIKQCKKQRIDNYFKKPDLPLLEVMVDNLLVNNISSGTSDNDEDDPNAVKLVEERTEQHTHIALRRRLVTKDANLIKIDPGTIPKIQRPRRSDCKSKENSTDAVNFKKAETSSVEPIMPVNTQLVNYLCGIFPDACPVYIKGLCQNKPMSNEVVDELTTTILNSNGQYPKRPVVQPEPDVFPENQLEILKEFLPDADPDYLRMMCDRFEGKPQSVKSFINEAMERRDYPTMKEYQRRQQLSAQQKQYTTEFNVENFVKLIPDPHRFFSDSSRVVTMDPLSSHYALVFLRNTFTKLPVRVIQSTFTKNSCNLSKTYKDLNEAMSQKNLLMKSTRKPIEMPNSSQNIPLLQEIAYYAHQKEINTYLEEIKKKEEAERQEALSKGLLKSCDCCYDEEVLPRDIFTCENGCSFCKSCIVKSTEVRFGEGKLDFPCLMNCTSQFSLQTLQAVLSPKLFSKIAQKKALEEVKAAGIEELEMCPFCDFATIPATGYSIFSCLNPDCMKESCRFCKEPSHIPYKCDEIEKDEDVKARVFVENKMTEALLKKCWKCGIKFFKEEGCNKMTCSCGASMCYVCGKPVTDYKHFNGNGGDRFDLCPLYSDTNVLNKENVLKAAEQAKAEIGNKSLKHDPTADIDKHYKERAAKFPQQQLLVQQQRQAEVFLVQMRDALDQLERGGHHRLRHHHHHHQFPF